MPPLLSRFYNKIVFDHPRLSLLAILLLAAVVGIHVPKFKLDASADSLILENDKDLRYFRAINKKYGTEDFLIITFSPKAPLLSEESLDALRGLKRDLEQLDSIKSVVSILDVPLFNSPKVRLSELDSDLRTLDSGNVDKELALREFKESPIYNKLLVSEDGQTTAVLAYYKRDEKYYSLLEKRNDLREKKQTQGLTPEEEQELEKAAREYKQYLAVFQKRQADSVRAVRAILDKYRDRADIFLGGVPMIASDMIDFIRSDIETFGLAVFSLMVIVMWMFFRALRWVALPLLCCAISAWLMIGFLGWLDWRVTVISSNFISILIIITTSLTIHLIVRYGEQFHAHPEYSQDDLVSSTVCFMFKPCFFTSITTVVAFCSLVVSDIRPVIDFGWMMTLGIVLGFVVSFIFFPSFLQLLKPYPATGNHDITRNITVGIGRFSLRHKNLILTAFVAITLLSTAGIFNLRVDNRFIDYFREDTEIYQGMSLIDKKLGGTTPLEIVIDAPAEYFEYLKEMESQKEEEEIFEDPFSDASENQENFWFHPDKLLEVEKIHDYLDSLPQIGKVLSIATTFKMVRFLNDGKIPDDYDLAIFRKLIPDNARKTFIDPYLSPDANQVRIIMRIEETDPTLNRGQLIEKIRKHLVGEMGIDPDRLHFTGMAVLYNNMLHSLYRSQILTLGFVLTAIFFMFVILFRHLYIAMLAIIPNIYCSLAVLGFMGWMDIPLDMMTITIAAITLGISVDDTIHYIHRFREEFKVLPRYKENVIRCHGSIGRAMYYTSITITVGFSVLVLSNFIPTIYFGLLTGLAMILAILGDLVLLPLLITQFKPLGPENPTHESDKAQPA